MRVGSSTDALTPLAGAHRSLAARTQQWLGLSAIALAALAGDQLTKHIVSSHLALDAERHVAGPLSIHHVQNSGIAFGLFASATPIVTILTAVAVGWMLIFFARSGARHPVLPVALGLLIGGSASNLTDRIRLGHVTDFIDLRYWPAFNLADSFIVLGVLVLLAALLLPQRPQQRPRPVPDVPHPGSYEAAGDRLDRFLAELPEIGSRSAAERLLASGAVLVDGSVRPKSHRLEGGEELEVELPAEVPATLEPEEVDFRVAYEDEHLLIVDKPAGIVVHPGAGHGSGTLVHGLVGRSGGGEADRPGIVHRLDRDTSGLLVVARSEEAHKRLQDMFRSGRWSATISRSSAAGRAPGEGGSRHRSVATGTSRATVARHGHAREAVTHFEVDRAPRRKRLAGRAARDGRTHQIRVHLAAVDLPVVGDPVYGVPDQALGRQFLHANRLAFEHPFTGERVEVESPLPPELDAYLGRLRGSG